jgi:hypothetical protein
MIGDAEPIQDHLADAPQGPALGLGPGLERPPFEEAQDLLPSLRSQRRGATRAPPAPEGIEPLGPVTHRLGPLTDGLGRHAESGGDLGASQPALTQEATALEASFLRLARCQPAGGPHA